jgi:hypothetical protein
MEQVDHNMLFCWFMGLSINNKVWDATVLAGIADIGLRAKLPKAFLKVTSVMSEGGICSRMGMSPWMAHLAWTRAGQKSFEKKGGKSSHSRGDLGSPAVDFKGKNDQTRRVNGQWARM